MPLWQHVMVRDRLMDLFELPDDGDPRGAVDVSTELVATIREQERRQREARYDDPVAARRAAGGRPPRSAAPAAGAAARGPSRADVIERLERDGLLPAITFIFSRAGCDAAVQQCLRFGLRLTTPDEARAIRDVRRGADRRPGRGRPRGAGLLGVAGRARARPRGPPRRPAADVQGGRRGAVRARADQGGLRDRDPGARHQHAGPVGGARAAGQVERRDARRHHAGGVHPADRSGRAARHRRRGARRRACGSPGVDPVAVAGLASTRTYPLRSSFRPTYNMAVNLVDQVGRERAREILETSFAQFQADRAVVGLARQVRRNTEALEGYREAMTCDRGDFEQYADLRRAIKDRETALAKSRSASRKAEAAASLEGLRIGDVIRVPTGRRAGFAVVVVPGPDPGPGRSPADDPDRGPAGAPDHGGRPAQPGRDRGPGARAARTSTHAARSPGATWPRPCAPPCRTSRRPGRRGGPPVDDGRRAGPAAPRDAVAPVPRLPGARGPRPLGRALDPAHRPRPTRSTAGSRAGRTRWPGRSTGSATC